MAAAVGCAALLPRLLTIGHFFNLDEALWMPRSMAFSNGLMAMDPSRMSAIKPWMGTMPGIPTVWLGSLGRLVWNIGVVVGVVDPGQDFSQSASGFVAAQAMVAIATAALIGLLTWLVANWIAPRVAVAAGIVLATEPFWVSLGSILHTDELVALFGLTGLVALSWACGLPAGVGLPRRPRRWMVVAGVLLASAALTKVSGLVFGVPAVGMLVWAAGRALHGRDEDESVAQAIRPILTGSAWMVAAAVVTVMVTYPALLFDFTNQWEAFERQRDAVAGDRAVFFLGEYRSRPGPAFYPVTLAYHSSAWFFLLAPVGLVVALVRKQSRAFALVALSWAIVPGVSLSMSGLAYARYGLVVLGPLTVAAACAVVPARSVADWWADRTNRVVTSAAVAVTVVAVLVAPWGNLTFNPIMAAYRKPILVLPVGWGEPSAVALGVIEDDVRASGGRCRDVTVSGLDPVPAVGSCDPQRVSRDEGPDYVVVAASTRQRFNASLGDLPATHDLIDVVTIRDQRLVEVWRAEDLGHPRTSKPSGRS